MTPEEAAEIAAAEESALTTGARIQELEAEVKQLRAERERAQSALTDQARAVVDSTGDLEDGINFDALAKNAEVAGVVEALTAARSEVERLRAEVDAIRTDETDVDWLAEHVRRGIHFVAGQVDPNMDRKLRNELAEQTATWIKAGLAPIISDHVVRLASAYVKRAQAERDRLAEQVKRVRLHTIIESALVAYWCLGRDGREPDKLDLAAAGSHAFVLVDALRHAGLPIDGEATADPHEVREAVTRALRTLDGEAVSSDA